MKVEHLAFQ